MRLRRHLSLGHDLDIPTRPLETDVPDHEVRLDLGDVRSGLRVARRATVPGEARHAEADAIAEKCYLRPRCASTEEHRLLPLPPVFPKENRELVKGSGNTATKGPVDRIDIGSGDKPRRKRKQYGKKYDEQERKPCCT